MLISEYNIGNKEFIGDKTPRHTMFIDLLKNKIKTGLKTVIIIRDSRAVVSSMKTRGLIKKVETGAAVWNFFSNAIINVLTKFSNNDIFLLKYEDIISNPESKTCDISTYLGISFRNEMLDIKDNNSSYDRKTKSGIFSDSLRTWEIKLSRLEINTISYLTRKNMNYFGYSLPSTFSERISISSQMHYRSALMKEHAILLSIKLGLFPTPFLKYIKALGYR